MAVDDDIPQLVQHQRQVLSVRRAELHHEVRVVDLRRLPGNVQIPPGRRARPCRLCRRPETETRVSDKVCWIRVRLRQVRGLYLHGRVRSGLVRVSIRLVLTHGQSCIQDSFQQAVERRVSLGSLESTQCCYENAVMYSARVLVVVLTTYQYRGMALCPSVRRRSALF